MNEILYTSPLSTQKHPPGYFIVTESGGGRSRENVTLLPGHSVAPGTLLTIDSSTGNYLPVTAAATNSTELCAGVSYGYSDTTSGNSEVITILKRDCEIKRSGIQWPTGFTGDQMKAVEAQLETLNTKLR